MPDFFYHLNHTSNNSPYKALSTGDCFTVGAEINPYFKWLKEHSPTKIHIEKGVRREDGPRCYWDKIINKTVTDAKFLSYLYHEVRHLTSCYQELILENIREKEFSQLPSRQSCLWLIPDNKECLQFWCRKISSKSQVLRLKVNGIVHYANESFLKNEYLSIDHMEYFARKYWSGENTQPLTNSVEVLFTGEAEVLEVLDKQVFLSSQANTHGNHS